MSLIESVVGTGAGLVLTGAWDKFMRRGQEDSSSIDSDVLLKAQLLPASVQVNEMVQRQQTAIEELQAQLNKKESEEAELKLREKQAALEKMTALAPPKQESVSASLQNINSVVKEQEKEPASHVVNVGKYGEKNFVSLDSNEITQTGGDVLKSSKKMTLVLIPMSTIWPMWVTAAAMCSDIAAETQANLIAVIKPEAPVSDTFRKFFKGDVYRDMNMEILGQLTQGYMPSVFGMLTMWSSWYQFFSVVAMGGVPDEIMAASGAEAQKIEDAGDTMPEMYAGAFMQGGLILLDGEGKIVWSYRGTTIGDYGTHSKIKSEILKEKEKLGY